MATESFVVWALVLPQQNWIKVAQWAPWPFSSRLRTWKLVRSKTSVWHKRWCNKGGTYRRKSGKKKAHKHRSFGPQLCPKEKPRLSLGQDPLFYKLDLEGGREDYVSKVHAPFAFASKLTRTNGGRCKQTEAHAGESAGLQGSGHFGQISWSVENANSCRILLIASQNYTSFDPPPFTAAQRMREVRQCAPRHSLIIWFIIMNFAIVAVLGFVTLLCVLRPPDAGVHKRWQMQPTSAAVGHFTVHHGGDLLSWALQNQEKAVLGNWFRNGWGSKPLSISLIAHVWLRKGKTHTNKTNHKTLVRTILGWVFVPYLRY